MIKKYFKFIFILLLSGISIHVYAEDLIITHAKIINPASKIKAQDGSIVIRNDRIIGVFYGSFKIPPHSNVYDAKNQYVIPGLIDSHTHIDTVLGLDDQQYTSYPHFVTEYRNQLPHSFLYFGYTTIIDLVTADQKAINTFNANIAHPDLYTCGGGVVIANGYPMQDLPIESRFNAFPNFLYEPDQHIKLPHGITPALHTPSAIINRIVNAHGICVKIFYESGFGANKNLPLPHLATIQEIVKLAHQHHLPVLMHANSYIAQEFALASGIDILAHGLWNFGPYDGQPQLPLPIKELLNQVVAKHLGYQPTIQVVNGLYALVNPDFLNDPQLNKVIPTSLLEWYQTKAGQWYANLIIADRPRIKALDRLQLRVDQVTRVVHYLQKNNALLLFGTDTPSSPTYGNPPGYNGYLEMKNWYRAGVSLPEILRAATMSNAKMFHLEKDYGSISSGKFANLILMKKNPLLDISAYDSISSVILHGKVFDRTAFLANKSKSSTNKALGSQ